jgi:membrane dipeptidase
MDSTSTFTTRTSLGFGIIGILLSGATVLPQSTTPPIVMDGHIHLTNRVYWERIDPWKRQAVGPFDFARARTGGVNAVIDDVAAYSYEPYNGTVKQVLRLIEAFHETAEAHADDMAIALSAADIRRIVANGKLAIVLGVEAGFDEDGDADVLRAMHRLGLRVIQFSGQKTTAYADVASDSVKKWNGLNARGRELVREMNRLGILIDITHASEESQLQIIAESQAPVVASHIGSKSFCACGDLSDAVLKALAAKGGMVGLHGDPARFSARYVEWKRTHPSSPPEGSVSLGDLVRYRAPFVRSPYDDYGEFSDRFDAEMRRRWQALHGAPWIESPSAASVVPDVDEWAAEARHVIDMVGVDHVGIGLDFFQGHNVMKDFDATSYPRLLRALEKFSSEADVKKMAGENWLRVLSAAKVS